MHAADLRIARRAAIAFLVAVFPWLTPARGAPVPDQPMAPVCVEYFYEAGCEVCARVSMEILPELEMRFAGILDLRLHDTGVESNYMALARYQERLGRDIDASAVVIVDGRRAFAGWRAIRDELLPYIDGVIGERLSGEPLPAASDADVVPVSASLLGKRLAGFTILGVMAAGFIDGINPCAISTLVFFVSLLTVLKVGRHRIAGVGIAFCVASFVTYFAIGFGLLRALYMFSAFLAFRRVLEAAMVGVLCLLAALSVRDALRFRRTGDAAGVSLQLPDSLKSGVRRIMRDGLGGRHLYLGAFVTGAAVTAIESVCTGQVYVPTLVFMARGGDQTVRALGYLAIYNAMFIVPLVVVFVAVARGLRTERLLRWSRRHVVLSKILLAGLFAAMALLLVFA